MSVRTSALLVITVLASSCAVQRNEVEHDDVYVWRRHEVPTTSYEWRGYHDRKYPYAEHLYMHPFVRPSWYNYPYWNQRTTVIVVPKKGNNYQPGKRPDRGDLPGQNRNLTKPRRGRN